MARRSMGKTEEPRRVVTTSKDKPRSSGLTVAKRRALLEKMSELGDTDIVDVMTRLGVGDKFFTCYMCGHLKRADEFYTSNNPRIRTGITPICRQCAIDLANGADLTGNYGDITKSTIANALEYLDRPYIESIAESAISGEASDRVGRGPWARYITMLSSHDKYKAYRWRDSDIGGTSSAGFSSAIKDTEVAVSDAEVADNQEQYEVNRRDTIRFCGYDPFDTYPIKADKPRLYAQLVSFLDDEAKNDPLKLAACVEIVKKLNQNQKLSDENDKLVNDAANFLVNSAAINKITDTMKKNTDMILSYAKDNGISINNNNNKSVGQQTLSGKIKKLEEIGLREAKINTFDEGSLSGMAQVAAISEEARHKQIGYDENIAQEIKDIKVELVESLTKERDKYREMMRILLLENKDLKEYLKDNGLWDGEITAPQVGGDTDGEQ